MAQRNVPRNVIPFQTVYADVYVEEKAPRNPLKKYAEQKAPRNEKKNAELFEERNVPRNVIPVWKGHVELSTMQKA